MLQTLYWHAHSHCVFKRLEWLTYLYVQKTWMNNTKTLWKRNKHVCLLGVCKEQDKQLREPNHKRSGDDCDVTLFRDVIYSQIDPICRLLWSVWSCSEEGSGVRAVTQMWLILFIHYYCWEALQCKPFFGKRTIQMSW